MMYDEFKTLTGLSGKCMTPEMYEVIEKVYMNTNDSKEVFAKEFYHLYELTVVKAINRVFTASTLESKLDYIEGNNMGISDQADLVLDQKMWQLIELIK